MASVNKVFLIGRLTRDPELRRTPSGAAVADLGLAVNRRYKTKDGQQQEETLFVDVAVWNRQAENCCQYLQKGREIHVEGHLKLETWDDRNSGEKRSKIKVEAESVQFLGGADGERRQEDAPAMRQRQADPNLPPSRPAPATRSRPAPAAVEGDDFDDLPF